MKNFREVDGVRCRVFAGGLWLTYKQAAEYSGYSLGHIRDLAYQGRIETRRAGKFAEARKDGPRGLDVVLGPRSAQSAA